jgi:hypothetical protein
MAASSIFAELRAPMLDDDTAIVFALDDELRLQYANAAWDRFAADNGADPAELRRKYLGQPIRIAIPDGLLTFYSALYRKVETGHGPIQHTYECSSSERLRVFQMLMLPLPNGAGILCVNSLVVDEPHGRPAEPPLAERYRQDGLITMCSHCRRTKRAAEPVWDWVPSFLEKRPSMLSHGLCPVCSEYHIRAVLRMQASA